MFVFWWVRVRSFDLNKALGTYGLVTTSGLIKVWGVVKEADRTFRGILVKKHFESLSVHERISGKLYLSWY